MTEPRTYQMTKTTYDKLREELDHKQDVERQELAARLKAAIEMGDLSENADYAAAKEAQSFLEGRILELKEMIEGAFIVDEKDIKTITVVEEGFDDPETYMIVGPMESNPSEGKISNESPIGKALLKAKKGQTVSVETPSGEIKFKVLDIQ